MSDDADLLVFDVADPGPVSEAVLARLVSEGIVDDRPADCALGGLGHAPGPALAEAAVDPDSVLEIGVNGVRVECTERGELYCSPDGGDPWITCPDCHRRLEEDAMYAALHAHHSEGGAGNDAVRCPGCGAAHALRRWSMHDCAFGTVALFFWNWSLAPDFVDRLEQWAGTPLIRLGYRI